MGDSVLRCDFYSCKNNVEFGCYCDFFEVVNCEKFGVLGVVLVNIGLVFCVEFGVQWGFKVSIDQFVI